MTKKKTTRESFSELVETVTRNSNNIRVRKHEMLKNRTRLNINEGIQGDSIEIMMERLKEGEGVEGIIDRDLVYNDNETAVVNPLTNIRSDKNELMLEQKIGEYEFKHNTHLKVVKDDTQKEENSKPTEANGEAE